MSFYDAIQTTAAKLLSEKGQLVTLRQVTVGAYDPTTSTSATSTVDEDVSAVVLDYPIKEVDGTSVLRKDKKVLLAVGVLTPTAKDALLIGGVVHEVIDVKQLSPGGTPVMRTLQVRAGG